MVEKNVENRKCERVDNVEERTLLVVTVLRGKGTKEDVCRLVELYYEKERGTIIFYLIKILEKKKSKFNYSFLALAFSSDIAIILLNTKSKKIFKSGKKNEGRKLNEHQNICCNTINNFFCYFSD